MTNAVAVHLQRMKYNLKNETENPTELKAQNLPTQTGE